MHLGQWARTRQFGGPALAAPDFRVRRLSEVLPKAESVLWLALAIFACSGYEKRELRGVAVSSTDCRTNLVVDDDDNNGGKCVPILIGGELQPIRSTPRARSSLVIKVFNVGRRSSSTSRLEQI